MKLLLELTIHSVAKLATFQSPNKIQPTPKAVCAGPGVKVSQHLLLLAELQGHLGIAGYQMVLLGQSGSWAGRPSWVSPTLTDSSNLSTQSEALKQPESLDDSRAQGFMPDLLEPKAPSHRVQSSRWTRSHLRNMAANSPGDGIKSWG